MRLCVVAVDPFLDADHIERAGLVVELWEAEVSSHGLGAKAPNSHVSVSWVAVPPDTHVSRQLSFDLSAASLPLLLRDLLHRFKNPIAIGEDIDEDRVSLRVNVHARLARLGREAADGGETIFHSHEPGTAVARTQCPICRFQR